MATTKLTDHQLQTYLEYKKTEQSLVSWFMKAAGRCEHVDHSPSLTVGNLPHTGLPIYSILPLARSIAACPNVPKIPLDIVCKLDSVLRKRLDCMQWYRYHTDKNDKATQTSNARHAYPVQILREIVQTLKHKFETPEAEDQAQSTGTVLATLQLSIANRFEALSVEETGSLELFEPEVSQPSTTQVEKLVCQEVDRETILFEEYVFARFCAHQDYTAIEAFLVAEWAACRQGQTTTMAVTLLTEVAIYLVNQQQRAFERGLLTDFAELSLIKQCKQKFLNQIPEMCSNDDSTTRIQQLLLYYMSNPQSRRERISQGQNLLESGKDYFALPIVDKVVVETYLLHIIISDTRRFMPESSTKSEEIGSCSLLDSAIQWMSQKGKLLVSPLEIPDAFAFAFHMEILAVLLCGIDGPAMQSANIAHLKDSELKTKELLKLIEARGIFFDNHTPDLKEFLAGRENDFQMGARQCCQCESAYRPGPFGYPLTTHSKAAFWLRITPVLDAAKSLTDFLVLLPLMHLFNVCKQEGCLDTEWVDFDFLMNHQGDEIFFKGMPPTGRDGSQTYFDRMAYMYGFQPNRTIAAMRKGEQTMHFGSIEMTPFQSAAMPLLTFLDRQTRTTNPFDEDEHINSITLILRATALQKMRGMESKAVFLGDEGKLLNYNSLADWTSRDIDLTAPEVLTLMKERLLIELPLLDFDFAKIIRASLLLARQLGQLFQKNEWGSGLRQEQQYSARTQAKCAAESVLSTLKFSKMPHCPREQRNELADIAKTRLATVSEVFKDWLIKNGSAGVSGMVKDRESGPAWPLRLSIQQYLETNTSRHGSEASIRNNIYEKLVRRRSQNKIKAQDSDDSDEHENEPDIPPLVAVCSPRDDGAEIAQSIAKLRLLEDKLSSLSRDLGPMAFIEVQSMAIGRLSFVFIMEYRTAFPRDENPMIMLAQGRQYSAAELRMLLLYHQALHVQIDQVMRERAHL